MTNNPPTISIVEIEHLIQVIIKMIDIFELTGKVDKVSNSINKVSEIASQYNLKLYENLLKLKLSLIYQKKGDFQTAWKLNQDVKEANADEKTEKIHFQAIHNQGNIRWMQGDYAQSMQYHQEALALSQRLGNDRDIAIVLNSMGVVCSNQGKYQESLDYFQKSRVIKEKIDDIHGIGVTLLNIGRVYRVLGNFQKCLDYYQQALTIMKTVGNKHGIAAVLNNLGSMYGFLHQNIEGLTYFLQSLVIKREIGDQPGIIVTLNNLGNLSIDIDNDKALKFHQESLELGQKIGAKLETAESLCNLGRIHSHMGNAVEAEKYLDEAIKVAVEIGAGNIHATALILKAEILFGQQNYDASFKTCQKGLDICTESSSNTYFLGQMLLIKITALTNKDEALNRLFQLLGKARNDYEFAELYYEIFKLTHQDAYRLEALTRYKKLLQYSSSKTYISRIEELETKAIP